jgi:hypothetical protein
MRKINFLKIVLGVAAAMLVNVGVFGQVANADYAEFGAAGEVTEYVTTGHAIGYYAEPDPIFHPAYIGPAWTLAVGFTWNWTIPTNPGTGAAITASGTPANYVEITYSAVGAYVVNVAEQSPAAFGGCVDATPSVINIAVVAAPSANITTADVLTGLCGNQPAATVGLSFAEAVPSALAGYAFAVRQLVENIDAGGAVIGGALQNADTLDFPTTGKLETAGGLVGAATPYTWTFDTRALIVRNGLRTRYTYTLVKASDAAAAAANGVISAISEKSDYLAIATGGNATTYAFGAKPAYVAIVNPAPSTGPIYYVPNTFNY